MQRQGDEPVPGYRLQRMLGRGSFGEVWSATGPGGTPTALKFISLGDQQGHREFQAIQRIKQIRHAHLMPIIGIWLLDENGHLLDDTFISQWNPRQKPAANPVGATMYLPQSERRPAELVEAMPLGDQDLGNRLEACRAAGQSGIEPEELLGYLEDAAQAIDFLNTPRHDLGEGPVALYHGDIKPQNIMLVGGVAQLCDFGLARVLGGSQATTTGLAGTPAYIAPECIQDKRPHAATDQYSLAITYFELRTGSLPFDANSYGQVINAHLTGRLDLSALPPAEQEVIRRGTALDPASRYPTTLKMIRALQHATGVWSGSDIATAQVLSGTPLLDAQPGGDSGDEPLTSVARAAATPSRATQSAGHKPTEPRLHRRILLPLIAASVALGLGSAFWWLPHERDATPVSNQTDQHQNQDAVPAADEVTLAPENLSPTVVLVSTAPVDPQAGKPFSLQLAGSDPEGEPLKFEYRLGEHAPWQESSDGTLLVENPEAGELAIDLRSVDVGGASSTILHRHWPVMAPNREPSIEILDAPVKLEAGDSLHLRLSGTDPENDPLKFEWRNAQANEWTALAGNEMSIDNLIAGKLDIELRSVDSQGLASVPIERTWNVELAETLTNEIGMRLRLIPAGEFLMGSEESIADLRHDFELPPDWRPSDERPCHPVRITKPFYLGVYEVTKGEFAAFVEANGYRTEAETDKRGGLGWNGESFSQLPEYDWRSWGAPQGDRAPVVNVTWNDAQAFCAWLSEKTGKTYRLPTEAEWEYACRAGTTTRFFNGDDPARLVDIGNVFDLTALESITKAGFELSAGLASQAKDGCDFPCAVGQFAPNAWALHDMHGNVWEWCSDRYEKDRNYYEDSPAEDPPGPTTGENRVIRGGSWFAPVVFCRAALRGEKQPGERDVEVGFRVVCQP